MQRCDALRRSWLDRVGDRRRGRRACRRAATNITVSPCSRALLGRSASGAASMPELCIIAALPSATRTCRRPCRHALAGHGLEVVCLRRFRRPAPRRRSTIASASGCSLPRSSAGGEAQHLVLGRSQVPARRRSSVGLPSVRVPVLSTTSVSTRCEAFQRLGIAHQHAGLGAAAGRDHDGHRRRQPERAGAGDDEHGDRGDECIGERRRRAQKRPGDEGERPRSRSPRARNSRTPCRRATGSGRASAAPRRPWRRSARAWSRRRCDRRA